MVKDEQQKTADLYQQYASDSIAFIENVCGKFVPDCLRPIFQAWDNNSITVVISATGVGKTWSGAGLTLSSYICQQRPKIFITAAPPETNLKLLLWNEIRGFVYSNPGTFKNEKMTQDMLITPKGEDNDEEKVSRLISGLIIPATGDSYIREAKFSGKHAPYLAFSVMRPTVSHPRCSVESKVVCLAASRDGCCFSIRANNPDQCGI